MSTQAFKDLELDGESYTLTLFPADQGVKLASKLIKIVGEPLAELAAANGQILEVLPAAMAALNQRLVDDEVLSLCKQLCSSVMRKGDGSQTLDKNFNLYFRGKYGHLFKLLSEVVQYNFADFLDALPARAIKGELAAEKQ